jgi:imidazolonepropionase-like amidohydrolase
MGHRIVRLAVLAAAAACEPVSFDADLVIERVSVIDVRDGTIQADQDVFIEGTRIVAILPTRTHEVPESASVIEATGQFLIPGLWDSHVHSAASRAWHFPVMIAHGITGVRNMHSTVQDALGLTNSIRHDIESGQLLGPRFLANGPIVDGAPAVWPGTVLVEDESSARAVVDSLAAAGADFIKVYDSLDREAYLAIADQARLRGIAVDGHVPFAVPAEEAAAAGQRTVEHLSGLTLGCSTEAEAVRRDYAERRRQPPAPFPESELAYFGLIRRASDSADPALCQAVAQAYAAAGVAVVPTFVNQLTQISAATLVADTTAMKLVPPAVRGEWTAMAGPGPGAMFAAILTPVHEQSIENFRAVREAGVTVLAGTDVGNPFLVPGRHLHDELALLVEAGLTPLEALQAATLNPAIVFSTADSLGSVMPGYLADLVLLSANPLDAMENVRQITGVVLNGVYFDRSALDRLVAAGVE